MPFAYQITSSGLLGEIVEVAEHKPAPPHHTFMAPPLAPEGTHFVWGGGGWDIIPDEQYERIITAEKARQLAKAKADKMICLNNAWLAAEAVGVVDSSVGFAIDATDRANRDLEGLIISMEAGGIASTTFCDAANFFHEVSLDQLKIMRLEVIAHGQQLYARKWQLRMAIENAQTMEELDAIVISFDGLPDVVVTGEEEAA